MNEDTNNWWEKQQDETNANEEGLEQVEEATQETTEDSVEEVTSEEVDAPEPAETEEVPEINSEDNGDYEVFGSDEALVNHIVSVIQSLGKTATVHTDAANIQGGKTIVLCGNDWDAFVASCSANSGKNLVIQLNHDGAHFKSSDAGVRCGTNIISYDLEELKSEVAQRALPML